MVVKSRALLSATISPSLVHAASTYEARMTPHALQNLNRQARRAKVFGPGRRIPLDRNAKARVMMRARGFLHRMKDGSEKPKGKAYGALTAKFYAVLGALLYGFHNSGSGACFPCYEKVSELAGCTRSTFYEAIRALESLGLLTWENRIVRVTVADASTDLFGRSDRRLRVFRTSNAYTFTDPNSRASKSETQPGTPNQDLIPFLVASPTVPEPDDSGLDAALMRLGRAIRTGPGRAGL
jgi:Helix-turn-helix domain